ncbi:uncharacterized protein LOC113361889 isoform X1 [Papaver somniferum]|uniref:uncharacterized protein LOC113361889 isoform X1 n=1 Tax=Papaver somniferum TaxID=3469 RepID=UPI000E6F5056|nr:uncharacterized protein LOC113361889 isoform X1 [Papaver somniferum]
MSQHLHPHPLQKSKLQYIMLLYLMIFFDAPYKRPPRAVLSDETKEAIEVMKANKHDFLMKYAQSCDKNLLDGARSKYLAYQSKARKAQPLVDYDESDDSDDNDEFYYKKMIGPVGATKSKSSVEDSDDSDDSDDCYYKKKTFSVSEAMKVKDLGKNSADADTRLQSNTLTVKAPIDQNKDIGGEDSFRSTSPNRASAKCTLCRTVFNVSTQKHRCRICEDVYCDKCANGSKENAQAVDICDGCLAVLGQSDVNESVS